MILEAATKEVTVPLSIDDSRRLILKYANLKPQLSVDKDDKVLNEIRLFKSAFNKRFIDIEFSLKALSDQVTSIMIEVSKPIGVATTKHSAGAHAAVLKETIDELGYLLAGEADKIKTKVGCMGIPITVVIIAVATLAFYSCS